MKITITESDFVHGHEDVVTINEDPSPLNRKCSTRKTWRRPKKSFTALREPALPKQVKDTEEANFLDSDYNVANVTTESRLSSGADEVFEDNNSNLQTVGTSKNKIKILPRSSLENRTILSPSSFSSSSSDEEIYENKQRPRLDRTILTSSFSSSSSGNGEESCPPDYTSTPKSKWT